MSFLIISVNIYAKIDIMIKGPITPKNSGMPQRPEYKQIPYNCHQMFFSMNSPPKVDGLFG